MKSQKNSTTAKTNDARLALLFATIREGVICFQVNSEQQFIVTGFNHTAEIIYNLTETDIGQEISLVLPNFISAELLTALPVVYQTGQTQHLPIACYQNANLVSCQEHNLYRLPTEEIVTVFSDVTEQRLAEQKNQHNEERLHILGNHLPGCYLYEYTHQNNKPKFLRISQQVEEINGVKAEDVLNDANLLLNQIDPAQRSSYLEAEAISRRDLTDLSMRIHTLRPDGEWRWLQLRSHPSLRDNSQVVWVGMAIDITDSYLFELEINRLAQAVEQSPNGILITDTEGKPLFSNQAYSRITGYQFAEIYGKTARELLSTEITDLDYAEIINRIASGKIWSGILQNRHKDKRLYWEQITVAPIYGDNGAISNYLYLRVDITEMKRVEQELTRYKEHLEEQIYERTAELVIARDAAQAANRAKSAFLASMSHELRTPLNAILGFSNLMLKDSDASATQLENLKIISRSGEHLLRLINDVLDMAKIEAGRIQIENAAFDLGGLIRDIIDMMRMRAQEKGLQLLLDQTSSFPRFIVGDEARLRQILINLIGNSIKFTQQGGISVRLGTFQNSESHLLIEIEDTGTGIAIEDQEKIFEPFIQVGDHPVNQGSGLGLAITRQFVELMGGQMGVSSELGKGSRFFLELPLQTAQASDIPKFEELTQGDVIGLAEGQTAHRILIVDDHRENQLLLAKLMQTINFPYQIASNGAEAIEMFETWQPSLIFMDRRMPIMDGIEATHRIRALENGDNVRIVAVTASAFVEQRDELLAAGMDDFVRKPYRFNDIYDCLNRQLGTQYRLSSSPHLASSTLPALSSAQFAPLTTEQINELREALICLDSDLIGAALEPIRACDPDLYKILTRYADEYNYPGILNALPPV